MIRTNNFASCTSTLTAVITAITFIIAFFTIPRSGPLCVDSCFGYPYTESISRFPTDYIWMYLAIAGLFLYIVFINYIKQYAIEDNKKIYAQIGLTLGAMSALTLLANYFIQLSVVQQSLLGGELEGIALISQYNPHGIFIALEELGYILMSLSFLFMAPIFYKNKLERAVRYIFTGNFMLATISFLVISILYGINREYRFEIAIITINWITLIVSGILIGVIFKRSEKYTEIDSKL